MYILNANLTMRREWEKSQKEEEFYDNGTLQKEMGQPEYSQRTFLWICHALVDGQSIRNNIDSEEQKF